MTGGQWEVVGSKPKRSKAKNGTQKSSKEKKKQDNAYFEPSAPICESQTIYTAFLEKEKKEEPSKQKTNVIETVKSKDKSTHKKKKDKKNVSPKNIKLEEIFSKITEEEFKNHLIAVQLLYPETPLVWLKDMASFLNIKLDAATEDSVFTGKPIGYPSILLSKGVYKLILKTFNQCTTQMLQHFFELCLQNMIQDILKGIHTLGFQTVLQCLAQEIPSVATAALAKCLELCNSHQNRQNICLSVMWVAGQAGNNNLEAGFHAWTDLMFPLITTKTCSGFVLDYLEKLVCSEDLLKINKSIISVEDLFHILDFVFSKDLVKSVQKRLISYYPTLKALSYGPSPETVLRNYFPSYLHRLNPQYPQVIKEEILSSLVFCLEKDVRNYSLWRQLYSKNFNQSKMLIAHLNEQWENLSPKFPRKCLLDTLSVFQVTNEELISSGKKEPVVQECILINKELLQKINSQMFSWIRIVLIFVLIISLLLTYDILIHESFLESHTGKLMQEAGLLIICAQAGEKMSYYYGKICRLLEMYVPTIASWIQKIIGPYFELFWDQIVTSCVYVGNLSVTFRIWCTQYLQPILLKVDSEAPVYGYRILSMCRSLTVFLKSYTQTAIHFLWNLFESIVLWTQSSALIQNAMNSFLHFSTAAIETLQSQVVFILSLIKSYIPF